MINADDEVSLSYLLDPAFELINTAGKPLTDGYIEVYIHGTRNKYYCASDFDGTLHPFKIPLDALGANIVLASPAHSYDVYVYNKFGSLVMSRYNIQPKTGSGEIVHDDITVSSDDGSVHIVTSGQTNYDLSIQDTIDRVDVVESNITNLATSIEEISNVVTGHDVDIEDLKANKKDKQEEYVAIGGPTKTITKVEQDEDGKMTVTYEDIDLPQEVPNVEITSPNGTINIASSIDIATNTKTFEIDVDGHEPDWHYWTANNSWTTLTDGAWKDINRPTMGAGKAPHSWTPEVKLGVYDAKADFTVTFHNQDNSYTVPNQIIQIGFRAKLVGKNNADAIRYVDLGAWTYDPSLYTTESYQYNFAQESLRQNYSTSKILYVPNYAGDTEFYIYYQAALLNTDGSQHVTAIDPVCRAEITYFGYHEVVGSINGNGSTTLYAGSGIDIDDDRINVNIGEGLTIINNNVSIDKSVVLAKDNLVAGDNITITASGDNLIISSDADVSELATKDELGSAVDALQDEIDNIPAQVQSDWTEEDVDDPAYIQHKPVEKALVAGENITITDIGSAIEISSTGGGASGTTYTAGDGIDITNDVISVDNTIALKSEIPTLQLNTNNKVTGISGHEIAAPVMIDYGDTTERYLDNLISTTQVCVKVPYSQLPADIKNKVYDTSSNYVYLWYKSQFLEPVGSTYYSRYVFETVLSAPNFKYPNVDRSAYILRVHTTYDCSLWSIDSIKLADSQVVVAHVSVAGTTPGSTVTSDISATDFINAWKAGKAVYAIDTNHSSDVYSIVQGSDSTAYPTLILATTSSSTYLKQLFVTSSGWAKYTPDFTLATTDNLANKQDKLTAGDNITISQLNVISSKDWSVDIASAVTDFATKTELASAIDAVEAEIPDVSTLATKTELGSAIDELQSEINNIPAQVQANWNEVDQTSKSYIQNKPSIPTKTSDLQNDSNFATTTDLEAYIPYSASGVELPNSNFEIGVDGQAYKTGVESCTNTLEVISNWGYYPYTVVSTTLETGVTYTLTVQGAEGAQYSFVDYNTQVEYYVGSFDSDVYSFTWLNETATVVILVNGINLSSDNTTLTYVKSSKERYVLESELASAIPEVTTYVAGEGITFTASGDDVIISSTGGGSTYTAGVGITIDNDVLNVDTSVIAPISAIPEDKVIKLQFDRNASWNDTTISSWAQSEKLVYLFVPANSYFPSDMNVPITSVFDRNDCWLRLTSTPMNADMPNTLVVFSGVLRDGQNAEADSYNVTFTYNKSKMIGSRWSCSYSKVLTSSDIPDTSTFATKTELASAIDAVEAEIPTATSDLQNDSNFVTTTDLASAIPDLNDLNTAGITDIQIVNALPASPVATVLYLVRE